MAGIMLDPTGKRQKWGAKRKFELKRRTGRQNYLFRVRCGQNPPDLAKIELYAFSGIPDFAPPTLRGLNSHSPTLRGLMTADFARNGICAIARLVEFAQIKMCDVRGIKCAFGHSYSCTYATARYERIMYCDQYDGTVKMHKEKECTLLNTQLHRVLMQVLCCRHTVTESRPDWRVSASSGTEGSQTRLIYYGT
ncbi:hypothetical protein B0H11DRAFT_2184461 [Mycena galericulata]|nr:hypothetical protein B0H11DRAFT_2184461 [Mycena galericulata]